MPESEDSCIELMKTVTKNLLVRYPLLFKVLEDKKEKGKVVRTEITKEDLDITYPLKQHPLIFISKLAKEDFYIVKNSKDDQYYLVEAEVPFPGGRSLWNSQKIVGCYL